VPGKQCIVAVSFRAVAHHCPKQLGPDGCFDRHSRRGHACLPRLQSLFAPHAPGDAAPAIAWRIHQVPRFRPTSSPTAFGAPWSGAGLMSARSVEDCKSGFRRSDGVARGGAASMRGAEQLRFGARRRTAHRNACDPQAGRAAQRDARAAAPARERAWGASWRFDGANPRRVSGSRRCRRPSCRSFRPCTAGRTCRSRCASRGASRSRCRRSCRSERGWARTRR
jgi:hypothetical protein